MKQARKYLTKSSSQTRKLAENLARKILAQKPGKSAVVLALKGELGSGKTTFLQGFAKGLNIKEKVLSPTFVILKKFKILRDKRQVTRDKGFENFYHIDCYRLKNERDLEILGFRETILNPQNIVAVEWSERVKKVLPRDVVLITFNVVGDKKRKITLNLV